MSPACTDGFYTTDEIARVLNVQPATVRHWARVGKIPSLRIGYRTLRFQLDAVVEALKITANPTGDGK